jgi:hypothetical protein
MYVMEVLLRGRIPLCLLFANEVEAYSALERLEADIAGAQRGSLLTIVQDDARCVAFLKRDFRAVEISRQPDDDGGEEADDGDDGSRPQRRQLTPPVANERPSVAIQRLRSPLDVALNDSVAFVSSGERKDP